MKQKLINVLKNIANKYNIKCNVELTDAKNHSDFATNLALKGSKETNFSKIELAEKIINELKNINFIKKLEIAGPGFINIFVKEESFSSIVNEILSNETNFGKGSEGKFINVEYVSANPTGFLHVGHARNATFGETLCNLLEFAGNKVDREYWINDFGNQINLLGRTAYIRYQQLFGKEINLPENSYKGKDIVEFAKIIKEKENDKFLNIPYEECAEEFKTKSKLIALDFIKKHIDKIGIKFNIWTSEEEVRKKRMLEFINKLKDVYEKDGALWLATSKYGDDKDRVLKKSDGSWTYFAPDIALHNIKAERGYDEMIDIWGSDHIGYIKRIQISYKLSGYTKNNLNIITIQFVNLLKDGKELKMSKRLGTSFTLNELHDLIGKDALRYYMLSKSNNSLITFDIEEVIKETKDNPVFSIQYTYARCNQLLNKSNLVPKTGIYINKKEIDLINELSKWPSLVKSISKTKKLHLLTKYLISLSSKFNSFYSNIKIIGNEREPELLGLVKATKNVLSIVLKIIGVSAPEKMKKNNI